MSVCVCQREGGQKERQRESRAGLRVKGGADPGGAQGSRWRSVSREGVVFWVAALVLIETSNVTKTDLTGWVNGAAVTEQPYVASNTLRPPLSPRLAPPYCSSFPPPSSPRYINLFLLLVIKAEGQFDMSELDVCVHRRVKLPFGNHTSG